ncbi:unnamed protein product [Brassica oleracea]
MVEQQKKKRFALFLTKCDSEFVKKVNGGYFNIFISTCGEDVRDLPWLSLGSVVAELRVAAVEFQRVDELGIQLQFHCLENP